MAWRPLVEMGAIRFAKSCAGVVAIVSLPSIFLLIEAPKPNSDTYLRASEARYLLLPIGAAALALLTQARMRFINRGEAIAFQIGAALRALKKLHWVCNHFEALDSAGGVRASELLSARIREFEEAAAPVRLLLRTSRVGLSDLAERMPIIHDYFQLFVDSIYEEVEKTIGTLYETRDAMLEAMERLLD